MVTVGTMLGGRPDKQRSGRERGIVEVEFAGAVMVFALFIVGVVAFGVLGAESVRCVGAARMRLEAHRLYGQNLAASDLQRGYGGRTLQPASSSGGTSGSPFSWSFFAHFSIGRVVGAITGLRTERVSSAPARTWRALNVGSITVGASAATIEGTWSCDVRGAVGQVLGSLGIPSWLRGLLGF